MKKKILSIGLTCFCCVTFAQQVVFTTLNNLSEEVFYRVDLSTPLVYENISNHLDAASTYPGKHKGPISVSHNGEYYVFKSERFEDPSNTDGYEAITICKSDFTNFEVPKNPAGDVFHADGIMQISNDGNTIYCVKAGPVNGGDIYKLTRISSYWEEMDISASSPFNFNIAPYLSYQEDRILFESSNDQSMSTSISQVQTNGVGFSTYTSISQISNCTQMKSPCYDMAANVIFEAETDAERIWKINVGGSPEIINTSYTNDNSPVTLPDGKVISVFIGASTHQIKVMDISGVNLVMLTESNSEFDEVFDIGISAGASALANVNELKSTNFEFFPNPSNGSFQIRNNGHFVSYSIYDQLGKEIITSAFHKKAELQKINSNLNSGMYFLVITDEIGNSFNEKISIAK